MKIASINERLIGALIDFALWIILTLIAYQLNRFINNGIIIYSIIFLPFLFKDITGRSPGKKLVKIKIISEKRNTKPNVLMLVIRNLFFFILIIDVPFIFFNKRRKRLIDIIIGTVVVKV